MMSSSKMWRHLMKLRLKSSSSLVVPFPIQNTFNQQITSNLRPLSSSPTTDNSSFPNLHFLLQALDAMAVTQKLARESLDTGPAFRASDREAIEHYLDDNVELLDACNGLSGKLDSICNYIESIRSALRLLEGHGFTPGPTAVARVDLRLASCESILETGPTKTVKKLRKKIARRTAKSSNAAVGALVILHESLIVTSSLCEVVDSTLSLSKLKIPMFRPGYKKRSINSPGLSDSLQELRNSVEKGGVVWELRKTAWLAQELRQELKSQECGVISNHHHHHHHQVMVIVEELQRSSDELYKGIQLVEAKVREVYGNLMSLRMGLLGKLSFLA